MATISAQTKLQLQLERYRKDPVAFVREVINVEPTSQQIELIEKACGQRARVAVKSCTASGKTAVLAWLTFYFLICFPNCRGLVTAPTANQLHRVFRSELALWLSTMREPYKSFFEIMSDKVFVKGKKDTQFFGLVTGSPENKESFAGLHGAKVVVMVDEASALPEEIFDTLLGTLSKGECHFILVSNPVRASGSFYQLFQTNSDIWDKVTFTAYESPNVNEEWIEEVIDYYGSESDFVKMRVNGEFPSMSNSQFISTLEIEDAMNRTVTAQEYHNYPRYLGCDPARFGDDSSVIVDRQGPKVHGVHNFQGLDTVQFATEILKLYRLNQYHGVFVDAIGVGAGVVDQLNRFNVPVVEVTVNSKSSDPKTYSNLRAQVYGHLRDWLTSADLPRSDNQLAEDLSAINYFYNNKLQIVLEAKKDMKKRIKRSPDRADALSLTFAKDVYAVGHKHITKGKIPVKRGNYLWA